MIAPVQITSKVPTGSGGPPQQQPLYRIEREAAQEGWRIPISRRVLREIAFLLRLLLWSPVILFVSIPIDIWDWATGDEDHDANEERP